MTKWRATQGMDTAKLENYTAAVLVRIRLLAMKKAR